MTHDGVCQFRMTEEGPSFYIYFMNYFEVGNLIYFLQRLALFLILVFISGSLIYSKKERSVFYCKILLSVAVLLRVFYATTLTVLQYIAWKNSESLLIQSLVESPIDKSVKTEIISKYFYGIFEGRHGYFIFYSFGRFWINFLLVICMALVFFLILYALRRYKSRFIEKQDICFGVLGVVIVGWPSVVLYVPSVFIMTLIISIGRRIFGRATVTSLKWPLIIAAVFIFFFGNFFLDLFKLVFLKI